MNKLFTFGTIAAAGVVGAGMMVVPGVALVGGAVDDAAVKREDGVAELVLVDDDDDDDTGADQASRNTRTSRASRDQATTSRVSRATRASKPGGRVPIRCCR